MLEEFIKSLSDEQKRALIENLNSQLGVQELKTPEPEPLPATRVQESVRDVNLDFSMNKDAKKESLGKKVPVTETKRFNSFTDDGTESKGEEFSTPEVSLTERRRPPAKKVSQTCSKCGKTVEVHPTHAREWFSCDKCIGAR
jgi:hypothetical protein